MGIKLDIPFDVGDPVLVIKYSQHDGYYLYATEFSYEMMGTYMDGKVFRTRKEADAKLKEMQNKQTRNLQSQFDI